MAFEITELRRYIRHHKRHLRHMHLFVLTLLAFVLALTLSMPAQAGDGTWVYRDKDGNRFGYIFRDQSVARQWNEELLEAIRHDLSRPTVHARNLYHLSVAMWDAWAAYEENATTFFHKNKYEIADKAEKKAAREEAISYAAYRLLSHRFEDSPDHENTQERFDRRMRDLGYEIHNTRRHGDSPSALGNRIADKLIELCMTDGANEDNNYANRYYWPKNQILMPAVTGNMDLEHPNHWQPLVQEYERLDNARLKPTKVPAFLSAEWGDVVPFALSEESATTYKRFGHDYTVYHDPGQPPQWGTENEDMYRWNFEVVARWSAQHDHEDGVMWDISPASIGNAPTPTVNDFKAYYNEEDGGDWSKGHDVNPVTGNPYEKQVVPRGDYARLVAEYWADGPTSSTPPGHWFEILHYVTDHPLFEKRLGGKGKILDDLEWDVKSQLAMSGALHDSAIAAWSVKAKYDYVRPISALRYMASLGQRTDKNLPSYHPKGIDLVPGHIEVVTRETTKQGGKHEHLEGDEGKIAIKSWRGPDYIDDPEVDEAKVGWILVGDWWPYQRPNFITPPFAGYVSGHSTYSRAGAEILTKLTGSEFFPGGIGEYYCPEDEYLIFEDGPSTDVILQWATYEDASNQSALSRIWGGIHPPIDDIPGRHIGIKVAEDAYRHAMRIWRGEDVKLNMPLAAGI